MKTEDLLKELENEQSTENPSQQMDITQLQGALILMQGNLAEQQRQIAELSKTVTAMNNSLDKNYSVIIKTLDELPNRINHTYSNSVSTLCSTIRDKTATDNRSIEAIIKATQALDDIQSTLKSTTHKISKSTESVQHILNAYNTHDKKLSIERSLHYLFLLLFAIWLAYGRFKPMGNELMLVATIIIILFAFLSKIFIKEEPSK